MGISVGTIFKRTILGLCIFALILFGSIGGLMLIGVTVDLGFLKKGVETSAQTLLHRTVTIEGPVFLEFSTMPALEVQGVQVANASSGSKPEFFHTERARLQINFLSLMKGKLEIADIVAEDVALHLENSVEGTPNWEFGSASERPKTEQTAANDKDSAERKEPFISLSGINNISMREISVTYNDAALAKTMSFNLDNLKGSAAPGQPLTLGFNGDLQNKPYNFTIKGDSLQTLLSRQRDRSWKFTLTGEVVGKKNRCRWWFCYPRG